MGAFELPANIKQIGSIGQGLRIYVEDYVCSYLQQYAAAGGYDERLALLIGRRLVIDGQQVLFISGAVQGRYIKIENGVSIFTQKSMDYANEMLKKHFTGTEIVGWAQSQPSYGVFLNTAYAEYHINNFKEDYNVLFVIDPIEKVNCFYTYNTGTAFGTAIKTDTKELNEAPGYFIYYDKNRNMHEYMLENRADQDLTLKIPMEPETDEEPDKEENIRDDELSPETLIRNRQSVRNLKKASTEQKRILNLLVTLSAVLFIICFIMAAGLIQNQDRISNMENQIVQLSTSYRNLLVDLRDNNTTSVFAANPDEDMLVDDDNAYDDALQSADTDEAQAQGPEEAQATLIEEDGNLNLEDQLTAQAEVPAPEQIEQAIPTPAPVQTEPPTSAPTEPPQAEANAYIPPETYIVQQGDNLSYISMKFYGTKDKVSAIMDLNGMTDDAIFYGKVLKLPR